MKFVLHIEDDGFNVRYWDEINETIGQSFSKNWNKEKLHQDLTNKGFHISQKELFRAIELIDKNGEPFVIFSSKTNNSLDILSADTFYIDELIE